MKEVEYADTTKIDRSSFIKRALRSVRRSRKATPEMKRQAARAEALQKLRDFQN